MADVKEMVEQAVESGGKVSNEVVSTIISKLEQYAAGLGTTAEYLWAIIIKQAYITGVSNLIWITIGVSILIGYGMFIFTCALKPIKNETTENIVIAGLIVGGVISLVAIMALTISEVMPETVTCFLNPEYWALQKAISIVK
jgi:hypothetical protein